MIPKVYQVGEYFVRVNPSDSGISLFEIFDDAECEHNLAGFTLCTEDAAVRHAVFCYRRLIEESEKAQDGDIIELP